MKYRLLILCVVVFAALPAAAEEAGSSYLALVEQHLAELSRAAQKQIADLHDAAQNTGSASEKNVRGTVTSELAREFADSPAQVGRELDKMQTALRLLVGQAARQVEQQRQSAMLDNSELGAIYASLPKAAAKRVDGILAGIAENNVGVASIYFALQLFFQMNNEGIAEAQSTQSPMRKRELYITQAAYVYEISNVVVEVIKRAELNGLDSLRSMRDDNQSRIARRLAEINMQRSKLRDDVQAGNLSDENARRMERSYVQIIRANQEVSSAWDNLLASTRAQEDFLDTLPGYVSQVEQKQQLARFQLDTLRDVLMVGASLDPLERVDEAEMSADKLPLLVLNQATLLQLVGGPGATDVAR